MKKIIITESQKETIALSEVNDHEPIFAVRNGVVRGMLIKEMNEENRKKGWIIRTGGDFGSRGYFPTRESAIQAEEDTDFYIELEIK